MTTNLRTHGVRGWLGGCAFVVALVCGTSFAHGQKSTEQYIPIGKSPGLSGKYTSIGLLTAADARTRTITIADSAGPKTLKVTDTTRIWLDRSKLKQSNISGKFADLVKGRRAEVKYAHPDRRNVAEWVKVEVTAP